MFLSGNHDILSIAFCTGISDVPSDVPLSACLLMRTSSSFDDFDDKENTFNKLFEFKLA